MVLVNDIWDEVGKIVGNSDEKFRFRRLTDAVELLANKGDFDPLVGSVDIRVFSQVVTLPPEIETLRGVNMVGQPALARDELFQFHLNGPGSCDSPIRYEWMNLGDSSVHRDLLCASRLRAFCDDPADVNSELWVLGEGAAGNAIRTKLPDGSYRDGYQVPVMQTAAAFPADVPVFSRITAVIKAVTKGPIKLKAVGADSEILVGLYQGYETLPRFRRIRLSNCVDHVRVHFRRRTFEIKSRYDLIPLHSKQAVIMMLRALKAYDAPDQFHQGEAFEATAERWLNEEQQSRTPEVAHPLQVVEAAPLMDADDHML